MSLHQKIKAARLRLGLTQAEAAAVCGVSPRAYWQWEAGKSTLDVTLEGTLHRLQAAAIKDDQQQAGGGPVKKNQRQTRRGTVVR